MGYTEIKKFEVIFMWNFLLVGSGNNSPSVSVSLGDNITAWFAENGDEALLIFITGVIVGMILNHIFHKLKNRK